MGGFAADVPKGFAFPAAEFIYFCLRLASIPSEA
jgi:hypothetical protein